MDLLAALEGLSKAYIYEINASGIPETVRALKNVFITLWSFLTCDYNVIHARRADKAPAANRWVAQPFVSGCIPRQLAESEVYFSSEELY